MNSYYYKVIILFTIFLLLFVNSSVNASLPLSGKLIVVDPGHGANDPGTMYKDIYEKDINLNISLYLEEELSKLGASVILTRDGDYDLSKPNANHRKKSDFDNRINLINNYADYYVSIHLNYLEDSRYRGIQIFSLKDEYNNASKMQKYLNKKLDSNRDNKIIPNNTYMYRRLNKSGLLIECGFLSNYNERNLLITKKYQQKLAKEIANGLKKLNI